MSDDNLKNLAKKFEEEENLNSNPYQQPKESERDGVKLYLKTLGILVLVITSLGLLVYILTSVQNTFGIGIGIVPLIIIFYLIKKRFL